MGGIVGAIASETELKPAAVRNVLHSLQGLAKQEVAKTGKFVIPQTVKLKPAKPAGKRMMFGKEVVVKAKKASKIVKAFPAAALKKAIWAPRPLSDAPGLSFGGLRVPTVVLPRSCAPPSGHRMGPFSTDAVYTSSQ